MINKQKKLSKNYNPKSLNISHIGSKGEGVAKLFTALNLEEKNYNFFVPFTLPNEIVIAKPTGVSSTNVRAELIEIQNSSPDRVNPQCQHFFKCGGCMLQHWNIEKYMDWKKNKLTFRVHEISSKTKVKEMITSSSNTRRHTKFTAKKNNSKTITGFYEYKSHFVVEIRECLILEDKLTKLINNIKNPLGELLEIGQTIQIHANLLDYGIDLLIDGLDDVSFENFSNLNKVLMQNNVIRLHRRLKNKTLDLVYVIEKTCLSNKNFSSIIFPPPGGFLQATLSGETAIIKCVINALKNYNKDIFICELFCGSGTITLPLLLQNFKIKAFEIEPSSLKSIYIATKGKSFKNNIKTQSRNLKSNPLSAKELKEYGAIILDPPRSGAQSQFLNIAEAKVKIVISISCDIDTFIRDAKILIDSGYDLEWVQPIDQFLYSAHVEVVGFFCINESN
jgi:23S rRNA (uracil1939-C5)-methyltransferase